MSGSHMAMTRSSGEIWAELLLKKLKLFISQSFQLRSYHSFLFPVSFNISFQDKYLLNREKMCCLKKKKKKKVLNRKWGQPFRVTGYKVLSSQKRDAIC